VAQCKGTTKAGNQCRRSARDGSEYCAIHTETTDGPERQRQPEAPFDLSETGKVILGLVMIGAIAFFLGGIRKPKLF